MPGKHYKHHRSKAGYIRVAEVVEVMEGHRLTVTYNLSTIRGNVQIGRHTNLSIPNLPWYPKLHDLFTTEDGWPLAKVK